MTDEESTPETPVADTLDSTYQRLAAEVGELGISGIVVYYSVITAAFIGTEVNFLDFPYTREMVAGFLLGGLVIDRFVARGEPIQPIVVGYTALATITLGSEAGVLNMPLPDTTLSGIMLGLLMVDYFTADKGDRGDD